MHKHLILLFISLFSRNVVFSQSIAKDTVKENDSLKKTAVFKKKDLPPNQKVSPEIFYIVNDKPVSREEYLNQKIKKQ
jgi:RecA/RadA recombinase